jgi:hypothetical protein
MTSWHQFILTYFGIYPQMSNFILLFSLLFKYYDATLCMIVMKILHALSQLEPEVPYSILSQDSTHILHIHFSTITFAFRFQCLILGRKYQTFTFPFKISFANSNVSNSLMGWASSFPAYCLSIILLFSCVFTMPLLKKSLFFLIICSFQFSLCMP